MQKYQDNGLRGAVLAASIELIMAGEPVTHQTLRARGVHGATATLLALRSELVRDGELPESVMPRKYVFGNPERGKVPVVHRQTVDPDAPLSLTQQYVEEYDRAWRRIRRIGRPTLDKT